MGHPTCAPWSQELFQSLLEPWILQRVLHLAPRISRSLRVLSRASGCRHGYGPKGQGIDGGHFKLMWRHSKACCTPLVYPYPNRLGFSEHLSKSNASNGVDCLVLAQYTATATYVTCTASARTVHCSAPFHLSSALSQLPSS